MKELFGRVVAAPEHGRHSMRSEVLVTALQTRSGSPGQARGPVFIRESAGSVSLSVRVALCHPITVDDAFSGLIVELMGELGATVVVPDDTEEPSPDVYVASQAEVCRAAIVRAIGNARKTWTAVAGFETAKLSCRDALNRFIVERGS